MGKGRRPCCDKSRVKKGPWSHVEDYKLVSFVQKHGHSNWRALPKLAGLARCGKSCRLRWVNYLRPDLKRGDFTPHEEEAIIKLHEELGNKWSKIASKFPGRTDNEIKNVWNTHLKKLIKANSQGLCDALLQTSAPSNEALNVSNKDDCSVRKSHQTISTDDTIEQSSSSSTSYSSHLQISDHGRLKPIPDDLRALRLSPDIKESIWEQGDKSDKASLLEELIEIPFEPNLNIWDMLDGDQSNSSEFSDGLIVENEQKNVNELEDGGSWWWWWLVYLENELGLLDHNEFNSLLV